MTTTEAEDEDPLYKAALLVEKDEALAAEMSEWERATLGDGLSGERYGAGRT